MQFALGARASRRHHVETQLRSGRDAPASSGKLHQYKKKYGESGAQKCPTRRRAFSLQRKLEATLRVNLQPSDDPVIQ
jgi:hypothetical protein